RCAARRRRRAPAAPRPRAARGSPHERYRTAGWNDNPASGRAGRARRSARRARAARRGQAGPRSAGRAPGRIPRGAPAARGCRELRGLSSPPHTHRPRAVPLAQRQDNLPTTVRRGRDPRKSREARRYRPRACRSGRRAGPDLSRGLEWPFSRTKSISSNTTTACSMLLRIALISSWAWADRRSFSSSPMWIARAPNGSLNAWSRRRNSESSGDDITQILAPEYPKMGMFLEVSASRGRSQTRCERLSCLVGRWEKLHGDSGRREAAHPEKPAYLQAKRNREPPCGRIDQELERPLPEDARPGR